MRVYTLLALFALLVPSLSLAQQITWAPPLAVMVPEDVSLSLRIGGDTPYGFTRAWVRVGRTEQGGMEVSTTQAAVQRDRVVGFLAVLDGLGLAKFDDTTVYSKVKSFPYWRDQFVAPRRAGLFMQGETAVRWIAFPHSNAAGVTHECAGFVGNGKAIKIEISGYWCVTGGKPTTEAEVQGFVGAIGYKNLLHPTPMAVAPGR